MSLQIKHDPASGRFSTQVDGHGAELLYRRLDGRLLIDHTGVPDDLSGLGVGKALVEHMVMDARARGLKVIPLCPFAKAMLQRRKDWQDILKDPF